MKNLLRWEGIVLAQSTVPPFCYETSNSQRRAGRRFALSLFPPLVHCYGTLCRSHFLPSCVTLPISLELRNRGTDLIADLITTGLYLLLVKVIERGLDKCIYNLGLFGENDRKQP